MSEPIDLGAALDAIVASLAAAFPGFNTVAAEDESHDKLSVPAILVQLAELEPDLGNEAHTGQFPCLVRFEARVVLGHGTPTVRREVSKAAGALAAFVHMNRLGVAWGPAQILAVEPDEFAPQADKFDVWMLEWTHATCLGESYFVDDGVTPSIVLTGWAPDIGPAHEAAYRSEDV